MTREEMYKANEKLVYSFYRKIGYIPESDRDDILQEMRIGLWKATGEYDPNKSAFSSFAMRCIQNEYIMYMRKRNAEKRKVWKDWLSLNAVMPGSENEELTLEDVLEHKNDVAEVIQHQMTIDYIENNMNPNDRLIFNLLKTYRPGEIAVMWGVTERAVAKRKTRMIERAKKIMGVH
jgi:RNA polymerase sigma factor (sigma-70 family)